MGSIHARLNIYIYWMHYLIHAYFLLMQASKTAGFWINTYIRYITYQITCFNGSLCGGLWFTNNRHTWETHHLSRVAAYLYAQGRLRWMKSWASYFLIDLWKSLWLRVTDGIHTFYMSIKASSPFIYLARKPVGRSIHVTCRISTTIWNKLGVTIKLLKLP